jgi:hypothetical protein
MRAREESEMQNQTKTIDAPGLVMTYSAGHHDYNVRPTQLAEAAIRVLGACLLLYQQYVPVREYYEVHPIQ